MMTVRFFLGLFYRGAGHDDMIIKNSPKNHHHAKITWGYDDMTKIHVSRARIRASQPLKDTFSRA
jgi:hypothetical protein